MSLNPEWPTDRLQALWALQQQARKVGNRVTVKDDVISVHIGAASRPFDTVEAAAEWHSAEAAKGTQP